MNEDIKFRNRLLQALEHEDVRNAVKKIMTEAKEEKSEIELSKENIQWWENKYESLAFLKNEVDNKLSETLEEKNELIKKVHILNEEKLQLELRLKAALEEKNIAKERCEKQEFILKENDIKIKQLGNRFKEIEDVYNIYTNLSENSINSLNAIFKGDTIEEFIFCGVQLDTIEALWEFSKREILEGRMEEVKALYSIFTYFLNAYNKVHETPIYAIHKVSIGEKFDEDKHIRSLGGKVSGNITEVIFKGYTNIRNGKIVKKSIVRV